MRANRAPVESDIADSPTNSSCAVVCSARSRGAQEFDGALSVDGTRAEHAGRYRSGWAQGTAPGSRTEGAVPSTRERRQHRRTESRINLAAAACKHERMVALRSREWEGCAG
jgi:hypothetical protein